METMVKVMATGTFDLLHMGHIYFLKEAKKLGDTLCVVVATDVTVRKLKHEPVNPEEIRRLYLSQDSNGFFIQIYFRIAQHCWRTAYA